MTWNLKEWLKPGSSKRAIRRRQEETHQTFSTKKQRKRWWHRRSKNYEGTDYDPIENLKNPEDVS